MSKYDRFFEDPESVPCIGTTEETPFQNKIVYSVLFCKQILEWRWYVFEMDFENGLAFGASCQDYPDYGYFSIEEMMECVELHVDPEFEPDMEFSHYLQKEPLNDA